MHCVYILSISGRKKIYIGVTSNLSRRLSENHLGKVKSTMNKSPKLIFYESHQDKSVAWAKEKWYKSGIGRKWIYENVLGR